MDRTARGPPKRPPPRPDVRKTDPKRLPVIHPRPKPDSRSPPKPKRPATPTPVLLEDNSPVHPPKEEDVYRSTAWNPTYRDTGNSGTSSLVRQSVLRLQSDLKQQVLVRENDGALPAAKDEKVSFKLLDIV